MFFEEFKKLHEVSEIKLNDLDYLFELYEKNKEFLHSSFENTTDIVKKIESEDLKYGNNRYLYFIKIGTKTCALIDFYLGYPTNDSIYLKYFIVEKAFRNIDLGLEIMRDFTSLALKEYKEIVLDCKADEKLIKFWNQLGFNVAESIDKFKIRLKSID